MANKKFKWDYLTKKKIEVDMKSGKSLEKGNSNLKYNT